MGLLGTCGEIGRRALGAFARGQATFALPEAAPAAELIARHAPCAELRDEARAWLDSDASYPALVRLCARGVIAFDALHEPAPAIYRPKAADELEPMLALWPFAIVFPTCAPLSERDLVELRAFPVHPLAVSERVAWVDGARSCPSEFFFHDLDHARFKLREDLLELGIEIADAYRDGTTLDAHTGRHRSILPLAHGKLGSELWDRARARSAFGRRLLEQIDRLEDRVLASSCQLLLFEILHEKSFPLERAALERQIGRDAHLAKLARKHRSGFFGDTDPGSAVVAKLPEARAWLQELCA